MPDKRSKNLHPRWSYSTNIYEVNVRQYTPEGTFAAFAKHLPRLKDMGVKILWFMPVLPISKAGRLGTLGSYYAARDFEQINPEFGTKDDFINLIKEAHEMGFKVIMDFVANHVGNDHIWITEHPEFFVRHEDGDFLHPHGWSDVSQLNYEEPEVWKKMTAVLKSWIKEYDIDKLICSSNLSLAENFSSIVLLKIVKESEKSIIQRSLFNLLNFHRVTRNKMTSD